MTGFGSCVSPLSDVGSPVEQLPPRRSQSRQQAHQGNGPRGNPLLCCAFVPVKLKLTRTWVHGSLLVIPWGASAGPEADGEGDEEGERDPGSEGERGPADSAPAGLRQRRHQPEQRRAHTGASAKPRASSENGERRRERPFLPVFLQELYQRCEKMRPTLFRLASDTEDNDEALGERWVETFGSFSRSRISVQEQEGLCYCPPSSPQRRSCRPTTA